MSMTAHSSAALIFDELEYEPFTENRRWPSGIGKIPRGVPIAIAIECCEALIRVQSAQNCAGVACLTRLNKLKWLANSKSPNSRAGGRTGLAALAGDHFKERANTRISNSLPLLSL
jgi:hypothetical protein